MCRQPASLFLRCCTLSAVCSAHVCGCVETVWLVLPAPILPGGNLAEVVLFQHFPTPPLPWVLVKAERVGQRLRESIITMLVFIGSSGLECVATVLSYPWCRSSWKNC
ncbi:hypothetical protein PVAP13_2NG639803 [Panicum virgatum]|uniref:Secreted protein n=1 Tax=Panicum virgatum TaxID=38727 RepID=A0A8T0VLS7_PANVG|nr:hypothetical protein PVAP13_2NG639803 [Panicum virgatum]